jgi:hypothetical protein
LKILNLLARNDVPAAIFFAMVNSVQAPDVENPIRIDWLTTIANFLWLLTPL